MAILALAAQFCLSPTAWGSITVTDDSGREIHLQRPARRILVLAPHAAELAFAAGAGDKLVGATAYCNYPARAAQVPRVGDAARLDREALLALAPDLVIAWPSGNQPRDLLWLARLDIPVYHSEPADLQAIADNLQDIGRLAGTETAADTAAGVFLERLARLRSRYRDAAETRVFFQVWFRPLITVGANHLITRVMALCRGRTLFPEISQPAASVSAEAVVAANPQAIVAAVASESTEDPFARWRRWPTMAATADGRFIPVPDDLISRPGPRMLGGAETICRGLHDY